MLTLEAASGADTHLITVFVLFNFLWSVVRRVGEGGKQHLGRKGPGRIDGTTERVTIPETVVCV